MTLLGAQLLSGQTLFTPLSDLPSDPVEVTSISNDRAVIVRENGDLVVVNSDGSVTATLIASTAGLTGLTFYRYPVAILQGSFEATSVSMGADGSLYFNTLCVVQGGAQTCALYKWNLKTPPERIITLGDKILTQEGFLTIGALDQSIGVVNDSVVFLANVVKVIRKTGAIYKVEHNSATPVGPFATATSGATYFSRYKATSLQSINGELVRLENSGATRSLLPVLGPGFWRPSLDFVRNEVYATAHYAVALKYRESVAHKVSPEPTVELLRTANAGPMTSNGLRIYLGLDRPWDGRSFAPIFDSLNLYSEPEKVWRKVAGVGDDLGNGKKVTGFRLRQPFEKTILVHTLEGWYLFDPATIPSKPTFNGGSLSGSRVSLPGFFPGVAPGQFTLTAHRIIDGKVEAQGVGVYPFYADLFPDPCVKENEICFTAPLTLTGSYVFRINVRGVDSVNTSLPIDFPLAPELKVELAEEVNVGETNLMRWETGNISGRITDPGCTPRISHVTLPFSASFGEIGWKFNAPTECNIEFTGGVGGNTKLYAKKSVRIKAPFVGKLESGDLDIESNTYDKDGSRLPLHAGGEMVIRGNNFTYEVAVVDSIPVYQPIRVEFEWLGNRATVLSHTPYEIRLIIPEQLAPGEAIVFQIFRQERVEEDGTVVETSTEPTYFKLSPKPQPAEEKKEE